MVMPSMNRVNKRIKKYKNMKTYRFLALSLAVAALSLTSAAKVENFEVNQVFKTGQSVFHILDQNAEQDTYTMASVALQWPLRFGDNDLTALQDSLLMLTFGETGNPDEVIENYLQHPQGYGDKVLDLIDDLPAEAVGQAMVLSNSVSVSSVGFCERYIVYKVDNYEYSGGAHPNLYSHFLNYDIKNNRVLDFNDIFVENSEEALLKIVTQHLLGNYFAESLEELGEKSGIFTDQIFVSRNVFLIGDSIIFHYNPYDIAPWSEGIISVKVPVYELRRLLTPEVRELYNL